MEETGFEPWHWKTKQNTKNNSKTVYEWMEATVWLKCYKKWLSLLLGVGESPAPSHVKTNKKIYYHCSEIFNMFTCLLTIVIRLNCQNLFTETSWLSLLLYVLACIYIYTHKEDTIPDSDLFFPLTIIMGWIASPAKFYVEILIHISWECNSIWRLGLYHSMWYSVTTAGRAAAFFHVWG
jgi:hypothetical protein